MGWDDGLTHNGLPEDDGGTIEEEGKHPDCPHLQHSLAGDVSLSSVFHLKQKRGADETSALAL